MSRFALVLLIACGQPPKPVAPRPEPVQAAEPVQADAGAKQRPAREAFAVGPSPVPIAVRGGALYWTTASARSGRCRRGGTRAKLATPDFAFKIVGYSFGCSPVTSAGPCGVRMTEPNSTTIATRAGSATSSSTCRLTVEGSHQARKVTFTAHRR